MGNKNSFWDTITSYMKFQLIAVGITLVLILIAVIVKHFL
jgi:hypothetical protein